MPDAALIAKTLGGATRVGAGWRCRCPGHEDHHASLSLTDKPDGRLLWHCHAGCSQEQVMEALQARGLFSNGDASGHHTDFWMAKFGEPVSIHTYRNAQGVDLFYVCRYETSGGKEIRPWHRDSHGKLLVKAHPAPRPLYRVPELLASSALPVLLVEGEKCADAAAAKLTAYAVTTWAGGAKATGGNDYTPLAGRRVIIWPDADEPGKACAFALKIILSSVAANVTVLNPGERAKGWDIADAIAEGWTESDLLTFIEEQTQTQDAKAQANEAKARSFEDTELARLAQLDAMEYDRARQAAAKRLNIRKGTLDKLVEGQRLNTGSQGSRISFEKVEPWPDPVNMGPVLDDIVAALKKHVILGDPERSAVALWVCCTWLSDVAQVAPLLTITSPTKRCGKTRLCSLLTRLTPRAMATSGITASAMFRLIDAHKPTLIVDEGDTFLGMHEDLRGVLNAGHTRDAPHLIRCTGEDHEPRAFDVFGFKALSAIGGLPDTIMDRSIVIEMRRKVKGETVSRPRRGKAEFNELRSKLARVAQDWTPRDEPKLPPGLGDRAVDNWGDLMLRVAEAAGGAWPERARAACSALCNAQADSDGEAIGVQLLSDIRSVTKAMTAPFIATRDLVSLLIDLEDSAWSDANRGKAINGHWLGRRLRAFNIKAERNTEQTARGYYMENFNDAFDRYLGPDES